MNGNTDKRALLVPVLFQGMQFYKGKTDGRCYAVDPLGLAMVRREVAVTGDAIVVDENRLAWNAENERVVLSAQHLSEFWPQGWERNVWTALESAEVYGLEDGA